MIEIIRPPRSGEISEEDLEHRQAVRERGKELYKRMRALVRSVGEPSAKAISPRPSVDAHTEGVVDRTWVVMREQPAWGEPGENREHMWFVADVVDAEDQDTITDAIDLVGITARGKLLPPILRDPAVVSYEQQAALLDGMSSRLEAIQQAAAEIALQAA